MNYQTACAPFAETVIDDLFRGYFRPVRVDRTSAAIKIDIAETDSAYIVKAEIPGVAKEDIQVSIEGNQVTIGAEVKRETETQDGGRMLRRERYRGNVHRGFVLPVEVDENSSNARYENGVLELTLAKKAAAAGRKLTVQ